MRSLQEIARSNADAAPAQEARERLENTLRQIAELVPDVGFARARDYVLAARKVPYHPVRDRAVYDHVTEEYGRRSVRDVESYPDDIAAGRR